MAKTEGELIEYTNRTINELVYPKYKLKKAYNYYNGIRDPEQFRYLETNFGIGSPTSLEFIPLIKKHVDALVGEYLESPVLPKITCKDSNTISNIGTPIIIALITKLTIPNTGASPAGHPSKKYIFLSSLTYNYILQ